MNMPIRVLLIEDVRADAELEVRALKRAGLRIEHRVVEAEVVFRNALAEFVPDVILSDFSMPKFDGMFALSLARELCPDTPFIFVSGTIGEEYAIRALNNGATDYVLKANLARLPVAVQRALQDAREQAQMRQIERALQESEAGLRRAQLMAGLAHVITGPDGSFESWSDSLPQLIGVAPARMPGSTREWLDFIHPEDRALFRDTSIEAGRRGARMSVEYRIRHEDGAWIHVNQVVEPIDVPADATGRMRWFNTLQDVTAQRQAAEALRASEERHRAMFEQAAVGIVHTTLDGNVQMVNPKFCEMSGYTRAEAVQLTIRDLICPEDVEKSLSARSQVLSGTEAPYELEPRLLRKDRSEIWVHVTTSLVRAADGRPSYFISVLDDISERKRAEHELQRFRMAMDVSADSIYLTDPATMRFVYLNHTACQRLGYTREQLLQMGPQDVLAIGREQISREYDDVIAAADLGLTHERPFVRSDGSKRWTELHRRVLRTEGGTLIVTIGRDITERKQADDRIRRLNRVYAVLSGINAAIVRIGDRDELFRETCRIAVEHGGFGIAQILLVEEEAYEVWPGPSAGIDTLPVVRASFRPGAETISTQGTMIRAIRERKPVFTNDITAEPSIGALRSEALRRGYGSVISLPLMVRDRIVAVLLLCAKEKNFFNEEELRLLRELAGDVSFALDQLEKAERLKIETAERLRAEAKVVRLNRVYAVLSGINALIVRVQTKEELYAESCRVAVEAGGFQMAWVGVVDREAMEVKPVAWRGAGVDYIQMMPVRIGEEGFAGRGLSGQAVAERRAIAVDDMTQDPRISLRKEARERGFHSLAILPLLIDGDAVGVLALYASEVGFFDEDEMKLLHELAGDISFALDHIEKANKLAYLAYYDTLTGLANRTLFHERLNQYVHAAKRRQGKLALVLADVERFKTINDSLGRQAGDELLKQLAGRLGHAADPADIARIGGDHFAIVLPEIKGRSEIGRTVAGIWRDCFAQPFRVNDTELRVSAKAGIALFPNDGADSDTLFAHAESALQKARETGERLQFHSREMTERVAEQLVLENKLRQALENDEFVLHYQPTVELESRRIVGVEALIRWQSPELGLVPPGRFIPLMEETGLILEVGAWALKRASLDHRRWVDQGLKAPRIAVNVSAIQLRQREFVGRVEQAIIEGVRPTGIDLEITESLIMEDVQGSIEKLKAVRGLGVSIAIDDFGTGYSSLGYLAKLPVQTLKIDRSFIVTMLNDPDTMTLVSTIISLAHSLKLKVVAEGVDAEDQAKTLRLLRCDEMQGYLFSRPIPFDEMTALLMQENKA
jgi:PAS domain S-box-containing protein/diguanylate cyclase (GGDEF)-like protein